MTGTQPTGNDTRPDWLLPKYNSGDTAKDIENQARAYVEAQKLLGQRGGAPAAPDVAPLGGNPQTFAADGNGVVAQTMAKINTALSRLQAGDPAAEADLVALGADPRLIRSALGTMQDTQRRYQGKLHEAAGGKDQYEALNHWITNGEDVESFERESYAQALASGDIQRSTDAIRHMTNRHRESTGYTPAQLTRTVPGGGAKRIEGYENIQEVGRATADPRYDRTSPRHDPAYAAEVQARMQISPCLDMGFATDIQSRPG